MEQKSVFTTEEALELMKKIDQKLQPKKHVNNLEDEEKAILKNENDNSNWNCIVFRFCK